MPPQIDDSQQWLSFILAGERYCTPVTQVKEILPYQPTAPIPGAPPEIEGMINIRGQVLAVVDGYRLLGLSKAQPSDEPHILCLETGQHRLGLVVDEACTIIRFEDDQIDTHATHFRQASNPHPAVKGTVRQEEQLYIVLDLRQELARLAQEEALQALVEA